MWRAANLIACAEQPPFVDPFRGERAADYDCGNSGLRDVAYWPMGVCVLADAVIAETV
jgi:hypothetical protein